MSRTKSKNLTLKQAVRMFEKQYVAEVLEIVDGNKRLAAERLGIHRNTLLAKTKTKDI